MGLTEWAAIVAVGLAVRAFVVFVVLWKMPLVSEGEVYSVAALRFVDDFPGHGGYYLPPGNPLALAAAYEVFGVSVTVARVFSIAMSVATVAIMASLTRELTKDERVVRVATWIAALYAPSVMLSGQPYTQHLAALCVAAVALFGIRAVRGRGVVNYALAGIVLGFGCLTRPSMTSLVLVVFAASFLLLRRARETKARLGAFAGAALFVACTAAPIVPVLFYNHHYGEGWTISTNNDRNFFLGNNKYTPNYKTSHFGQREPEQLDPEIRDYLLELAERPNKREAMRREAITFITQHPFITAYRTMNRATSFWGFDYIASRIIQEDRGLGTKQVLPMLALEAGSWVAVMTLVIAAVFGRAGAERDPFALKWLVALALAYELPYVMAFSGGSFHFPIIGLLAPIAALAPVDGVRALVAQMKKSRAVWVALGIFAAIQLQYAYYSLVMSG